MFQNQRAGSDQLSPSPSTDKHQQTWSASESEAEKSREKRFQFIQYKRGITAKDVKFERKYSFTASEAKQLREEFQILRMVFPVRCGQPCCATLTGPLRELWQTNLLVEHVLLRRMECDGCGLQFLVFSWGGSTQDYCTVQCLVMDRKGQTDRYLLGFPKG